MNELPAILARIPVRDVTVLFEQVEALIGYEKALELSHFRVNMPEALQVGPRSAIPLDKRVQVNGYAEYNREELLRAINEATNSSYRTTQVPGTNPLPHFDLLPPKKVKDLQTRGF